MSHKWMYRSKGCNTIEITEPEIFKETGFFAKAHLKIVAILGSARKGKSTLMNRIVKKDVFKTSNDITGCTRGVYLYDVHETTADGSVVMYVDTEGQLGNDTKENDIKLFAPVVFLSKVIIFNVMSAISAQELLDKLYVFVNISDRLYIEAKCNNFKFGHLIIALRDYSLTETAENACNRFFGKEDNPEQSAQERNKTREQLHSLFRSLEVFIFRKPVTETTTNGNSRVDEFKTKIHHRLGEPRKFGESTCLTPGNVGDFARAIVHHMNVPDECFQLSTLVESLQRNKLNQICEQYKAYLVKLFNSLCLPVDNFDKELPTRKMNELIKQFKKVASKADFACGREIAEKLELFFQQRLADKRSDNESLLKAIAEVKRPFENELNRLSRLPDKPGKIDKELDEEIQRVLQMFEEIEYNPFKEQVSQELAEFANEQKKKRKKENETRLDAREKVDSAKHTFKESVRNSSEECLESILPGLLEKFDKDTEDVDFAELDYKNKVRSKLEVRTKERIERTKGLKANETGCTLKAVLLFVAVITLLTAIVVVAAVENPTIAEIVAIFAASCAVGVLVLVICRKCRKLVNFKDGFWP